MKESNCTHCGQNISYGGSRPKKWCSEKCRQTYKYKNDPKYAQRNTYERQRSVSISRKLDAIRIKGGCCQRCGQSHPAALCFHHTNPEDKAFTLDGRVFGNLKWEKLLTELDKCELLCLNCHYIHHYGYKWSNTNNN